MSWGQMNLEDLALKLGMTFYQISESELNLVDAKSLVEAFMPLAELAVHELEG
ncbi:hypothetical protein [Glutamicibacter creatinolyticus]|uniref:hypothetical protein n=1 Tax=Glutamicibacter creatinolyticus TaxID=162496 RepID=UPI003217A9A5